MLSSLLLFPSLLLGVAPTDAATELVRQLRIDAAQVLLLAPVAGAKDSPLAAELEGEMMKALVAAKVRVVDRKALEAALQEAALGSEISTDLAELAGGFGATAVLELEVKGTSPAVAFARLLASPTAKVLAASSVELGGAEGAGAPEGGSLQVQIRRLADKIAKGLDSVSGGEARYRTFAVMPFGETGPSAKDKELGTLVAAEISTVLTRDHGLILVERAQLTKIIDELALGQSGLVDEKQSMDVGKLAGAEALVIGSVAEAGDRYLANARVVTTADGRVAFSDQATLPAADLVALSSEAVVLRTRSGSVYRSLLMPGWGQVYNREPAKAAMFVAGEGAAGLAAIAYHLLGTRKEQDYRGIDAATDSVTFDRLASAAEGHYERRNLALYLLLGLHVLNIVDAAWSGKSFDSASPGQ